MIKHKFAGSNHLSSSADEIPTLRGTEEKLPILHWRFPQDRGQTCQLLLKHREILILINYDNMNKYDNKLVNEVQCCRAPVAPAVASTIN